VTLAGTLLVILPIAVVVAAVVHVIVLLASRYMSLASLASSASVLPTAIAVGGRSAGGLAAAYLGLRAHRPGDRLGRPRRQHRPPDSTERTEIRLCDAPRQAREV
jgi:hypothetical protein